VTTATPVFGKVRVARDSAGERPNPAPAMASNRHQHGTDALGQPKEAGEHGVGPSTAWAGHGPPAHRPCAESAARRRRRCGGPIRVGVGRGRPGGSSTKTTVTPYSLPRRPEGKPGRAAPAPAWAMLSNIGRSGCAGWEARRGAQRPRAVRHVSDPRRVPGGPPGNATG